MNKENTTKISFFKNPLKIFKFHNETSQKLFNQYPNQEHFSFYLKKTDLKNQSHVDTKAR